MDIKCDNCGHTVDYETEWNGKKGYCIYCLNNFKKVIEEYVSKDS